MQSGFVVPYATELEFADLARLGEERGWDAALGWEALYGVDAWVQLGAAAMVTERIRLGTLLTPASRHRPWDLASRVGSVDRISGGRAFMSVGLGALHPGWTAFGADDFMLPPPTPQRPHPPVWVVGAPTPGGGRQRSLERAARWQGLIPAIHPPDGQPKTVEAFAAVVDAVHRLRAEAGLAPQPYDVVIEADSWGSFTALEPAEPAAWEQAGATWWIESWWDLEPGPHGLAEVRRRIEAGPPTSR